MLYLSSKKLLVFLLLAVAVTLFPAKDWAQEKQEASGREKAQIVELKEKIIQLETKRLEEKIEGVDNKLEEKINGVDQKLDVKIEERTTQVYIIFAIIIVIVSGLGYESFKFIRKRVEGEVAQKTKKVVADLSAELDEVKKLHREAKKEGIEIKKLRKEAEGQIYKLPAEATPEGKKISEDLVEAIKQKPISELTADDYYRLGYQAVEKGGHEEAIGYFRSALELGFDQPHIIRNTLGFAYHELQRYEEAIRESHEALRLKPDDLLAHNNLGRVYAELGRHEEAIREFQETLRLKPDFPMAHYNLGVAYYDLQKNVEAVREYQEALRIKPDYPTAHYNLACVYAVQGQTDKALSSLEQAIQYGYDDMEMLKTDTEFNSIRDTEKFKELVKIVEEQRK